MKREWAPAFMLAFLAGIAANPAQAQDLLKAAVSTFPPNTVRVEYSNPAKLRTLPNYSELRQRYVGPRLRDLEDSLSKLSVREDEIDELVLGWQLPANQKAVMNLEGLAAGRFDAKTIAERAAAQGLSTEHVGNQSVYCLGEEAVANCVAVLENSLGAFGPRAQLGAMLEARQGQGSSLNSNTSFMSVLNEADTRAPIWGVAVGAAVADWFRGWMPQQKDIQVDWAQPFQAVQSLAYSVDAGDKVSLDVKMNCATEQAAGNLKQVLESLKAFQQMAWQNRNPNLPNPFESLAVDSSGNHVSLKLSTDYSTLGASAASGAS